MSPALKKKLDILRFSIDKVGKPQCGTFYSIPLNFNSWGKAMTSRSELYLHLDAKVRLSGGFLFWDRGEIVQREKPLKMCPPCSWQDIDSVGSYCLSSSICSPFEISITKSLVLTNPHLLLWLWDFYSPNNQLLLVITTDKEDNSKTINSQERGNLCRWNDGLVCSWSC